MSPANPSSRRSSGVLLHPTSLPGPHGSGDLGSGALHFVDWLQAAGQRHWQMLPLGIAGSGDSPYMSPSAFAGQPLLIDLQALAERGWLSPQDLLPPPGGFDSDAVDYPRVAAFRHERLERAAAACAAEADTAVRADREAYEAAESHWLADFCLFMVLTEQHGAPWTGWPAPLATRDPAALRQVRTEAAARLDFWAFTQWCFDRQWRRLRAYAGERGIGLIGDVPIFIAHHSAEVWARPDLFLLDARGHCTAVAGVPPDAFSDTGQRWGNPLYRWPAHAAEGYAWWSRRLDHALAQTDRLRIDHFRGFAAHWEIAADEPTAVQGRWQPGPGRDLFDAWASQAAARGRRRADDPLPFIAEDLGVITPDVEALRRGLGLPGMRILQFAFGGDASNPYLPHRHAADSVVYTGTHDNDTTLGWWRSAPPELRRHVQDYLGLPQGVGEPEAVRALLRAAWASVADLAIAPMQDLLGLGTEARMNHPGQAEGWWRWRLRWEQVGPQPAPELRAMTGLYGREG